MTRDERLRSWAAAARRDGDEESALALESILRELGRWRAETGASRPEDAGAAIRNTREDLRRAEQERDEWSRRFQESANIVSDAAVVQERAEARLGEERAKLSATLEQVRQAFAARNAPTPGGGVAGILAGVDSLADRAESAVATLTAQLEEERRTVAELRQKRDEALIKLAEADNAALLARVHPGVVGMLREHRGHRFEWKVRCITCAPTSRERQRAIRAARKVKS